MNKIDHILIEEKSISIISMLYRLNFNGFFTLLSLVRERLGCNHIEQARKRTMASIQR